MNRIKCVHNPEGFVRDEISEKCDKDALMLSFGCFIFWRTLILKQAILILI